ncbi:MAG: zinc ABC transporter substrate-binding protein [Spirochaetes bacterium]|nr:zinc ABC transporter substrate-binding protein [Spirochaetota bacterium]
MKKFKIFLTILIISNLLFFSKCTDKPAEDKKTLNVFTSILPQQYFAKKIGGDRINVDVLVGPGKNPATYEPLPDQVIALSKADILFTIGVPFEQAFLPKIRDSLKTLTIIDTSKGVKKRMLESHYHEGEDNHHSHISVPDPHIWLSPSLVKIQASNIYRALSAKDSEGEPLYKKNYDVFIHELDAVNMELRKIMAPFKGMTLFVFHPSFGYFADEYGLKQVAIETGGKEPAPSVLEEIINHAKKQNVKIIFMQPEFSQRSGKAIAEAINGTVIILNPLNPDYINNLKNIASEIKKAYN